MKRRPSSVDPSQILFSVQKKTYALVEPLGKGGNASAFLVVGTSGADTGLPFAVKFFLHQDRDRHDAFLGEITYLQNHPHGSILPIYDSGVSPQGFPFYVSRSMATTLEKVIKNESAPMLDKLLYASQLASALAYLEAASPSILHRDLKATNVFVNGRTCLLGDFGMMQTLGTKPIDRTMPRDARTPDMYRYQNGGPIPTTQSDVFSLGGVLYRLFTGEEALSESGSGVTLNPLYSVGGRYARQLDNILSRMLEDDPLARPTPVQLLNVFTGLVGDEARRRRHTAH